MHNHAWRVGNAPSRKEVIMTSPAPRPARVEVLTAEVRALQVDSGVLTLWTSANWTQSLLIAWGRPTCSKSGDEDPTCTRL